MPRAAAPALPPPPLLLPPKLSDMPQSATAGRNCSGKSHLGVHCCGDACTRGISHGFTKLQALALRVCPIAQVQNDAVHVSPHPGMATLQHLHRASQAIAVQSPHDSPRCL